MERGLLGDGDVGCAARGDDDGALAVRLGQLPDDADARARVVAELIAPAQILRGLRGHARDEDDVLAAANEGAGDGRNLLGRLALAVYHLGDALTELAVQVDLGEAHVVDGRELQLGQRLLRRKPPALDGP